MPAKGTTSHRCAHEHPLPHPLRSTPIDLASPTASPATLPNAARNVEASVRRGMLGAEAFAPSARPAGHQLGQLSSPEVVGRPRPGGGVDVARFKFGKLTLARPLKIVWGRKSPIRVGRKPRLAPHRGHDTIGRRDDGDETCQERLKPNFNGSRISTIETLTPVIYALPVISHTMPS